MPSLRKLALIGLSAGLLMGCDAGSSPDNQARTKINDGRIAAAKGDDAGRDAARADLRQAANVSGASTATVAQAKGVLGEIQYEAGLEVLRDAERSDLTASQIALQIAAIGAQLGNSAVLVQGYQKLDPSAAKAEIEKRITEATGAPNQAKWITEGNVNIANLNAATQEVSRIQGEIAKRQGQIKDLDTQRVAALEEADKAMKSSDASKGQESVDAFKQGSGARKKAADLQANIDLINGQLMPLQQDLAIAQGQQQIVQAAINAYQEESKALDDGWKDVQSKVDAQKDLMKQIASAPDTAAAATQPGETASGAGQSIAVKAALLAQTVQDADKARQSAAELIGDAAKQFDAAQASANLLVHQELPELVGKQPAMQDIVRVAQSALSPQGYKLQQARAERVLAEMSLAKAQGISARMKLVEMLTPIMQEASQPVPKELTDPTLDKQFKDALTEADSRFKDAAQHLDDIINGPGGDELIQNTIKAAAIARIFVFYGQQQLASLQGNAQLAQQLDASARQAVKAAADLQVSFPNLPGNLEAAIPPPPAAATEPAAPSDTTPAPAAAPAAAPKAG